MKKRGRIIGISMLFGMLVWFGSFNTVHGKPVYNFSVTVDRAEEENFREKIEIYITKNGEYYGDYDLNANNQYRYSLELGSGTYQIFARVRYDQNGEYQVVPECHELLMTDIEHQEMHEIVFAIQGNYPQESENKGHDFMEYHPEADEEIYTMDRIAELEKIAESARVEASQAFIENEEWERENNFLAQNKISNPGIPKENLNTRIPLHSYPEMEEIQNEQSKESEQILAKEDSKATEFEDEQISDKEVQETLEAGRIAEVIQIIVILVVFVISWGIWKKMKREE